MNNGIDRVSTLYNVHVRSALGPVVEIRRWGYQGRCMKGLTNVKGMDRDRRLNEFVEGANVSS